MKTRKEIQWFAQEMEAKLRENDHKGGWQGCRFTELFPRIMHERDELLLAAHPLQLDTIAETLTQEDACDPRMRRHRKLRDDDRGQYPREA